MLSATRQKRDLQELPAAENPEPQDLPADPNYVEPGDLPKVDAGQTSTVAGTATVAVQPAAAAAALPAQQKEEKNDSNHAKKAGNEERGSEKEKETISTAATTKKTEESKNDFKKSDGKGTDKEEKGKSTAPSEKTNESDGKEQVKEDKKNTAGKEKPAAAIPEKTEEPKKDVKKPDEKEEVKEDKKNMEGNEKPAAATPEKTEESKKDIKKPDGKEEVKEEKKTAIAKQNEGSKNKEATKNDAQVAIPVVEAKDAIAATAPTKDNKNVQQLNFRADVSTKPISFESTANPEKVKDTVKEEKKVPASEALINTDGKSETVVAAGTITGPPLATTSPQAELGIPPLSKEGIEFFKQQELIQQLVDEKPPSAPLSSGFDSQPLDEKTQGLEYNKDEKVSLPNQSKPFLLSHPPLSGIVEPQMYEQIPELVTKEISRNPEISQVYFNWWKERERFEIQSYDPNVQEIILSPQLGYVLGYKQGSVLRPGTRAPYPPDLNGGVTQFGIYTRDLTENVIVGNDFTSLLRIVTVKSKPGEMDEQLYDSPMYVKVASRDISNICIEIRGMDGRLIPFAFGPVIITLHFKKLLY
uniref:Uncharacterized protein n=1 Tax=Panagrolaimus sp. ES5 TaxID=591445 RepID=A0AC34FCW6_9BILA